MGDLFMRNFLFAKSRINIYRISFVFYALCLAMMMVGTFFDMQISIFVFDPQSKFAIGFEAFGLFVYWGMWGPIFTVLFLTRHSLKESTEIVSRIFPFIKPIENIQTKLYKASNLVYNAVTAIGFFVLTVIGWKKLIQNVLKHICGFNEITYFVISTVAAIISIILFSRLSKPTLKKLEYLALAGVLMGIFIKIGEHCKAITHRVRFREMVAYSNNILDDAGMSLGRVSKLKSRLNCNMVSATDFQAYTMWFKKGNDMGVYSNANSFPSGHMMCSCSILLSALFSSVFKKTEKLIMPMLTISIVYITVMAYTRMVCGAHYLTDVAFGAVIGYTAFLIVIAVYRIFKRKSFLGSLEEN